MATILLPKRVKIHFKLGLWILLYKFPMRKEGCDAYGKL